MYVPSRPVFHDVLESGEEGEDIHSLYLSELVEESPMQAAAGDSVKDPTANVPVNMRHGEIEDLILAEKMDPSSDLTATVNQSPLAEVENEEHYELPEIKEGEIIEAQSNLTQPTVKSTSKTTSTNESSLQTSQVSVLINQNSSSVSMTSEVPPSSPADLQLRLLLHPKLQNVPWEMMRYVRQLALRSQEYLHSCMQATGFVEITQNTMELLDKVTSFYAWMEQM